MTPEGAPQPLTLKSELSELKRVVTWLHDVAAYFQVPSTTLYAMDLCLEEALSNIIRHGYRGSRDGWIVVRPEEVGNGELRLVIEDGAPAFDPLRVQQPPMGAEGRVGGLGIQLIRQFATSVRYERLATGNCLILSFSWPHESA